MAINFPSTAGQPTNGSYTFTVSGITYSWDGASWNALGANVTSTLGELTDVDLSTAPTTGQVLKYNGTNWYAAADGGSSDPVGTIVAWGGSTSTIPDEYQLCDGTAAQTSALSAITGTNVPDLRSRFIVGANDVTGEGSWPSVGVGSTGGSANAVLIAHSHTYNTPNTSTNANGGAPAGDPGDIDSTFGSYSTSTVGQDNAGNASTTQTGTNANLPPYYALSYIIKHTATSGSGSGSSNYSSSILSANGTNELEFTDIPSWATKVTLIAENILLPQTDTDEVGSNLEFGGSSGYLAANSYAYNLHYGVLEDNNSFNSGLAEVNNTPYRDAIVLYGSGSHANYPILSQVFITFQKVKGQDKWVFEGSASNRQGDPSTTTIDQKWFNSFAGSFTSTEAITKLKFYSHKGSAYAAGSTNYTGGSVTTIYEGEGSSSSGSSGQVSVKDFGAVGNGVANDKSAIQSAINSLGSSGGSIYFPHGDYLIDSQILIDEDRISLVGDSIGTKIICNNPTSGAIKVTKTSGYLQFFSILNLQIQMAAGASVTAGAALELDEVSRCNIQNVYIDDGFIGVLLKGVQQCNIDNLQVLYEDNNFGAGGTGRRFLKFLPGSTTNLHGGDIFITNFNGRCGNNFDCEYGVEVTAVDGLWISNSHIGNCEDGHMLIHHNTGVKTVGILCDNVWFDQTTTGTYGVVISGTGSSLAGFYRFNNCTFLASTQNDSANAIFCSGVAGNIAINDCEISGWGSDGIYANNTTGDNRINNCSITNCGLTNGDGIQIDVNTGWTITNNKIVGGQHQHHIRVVQPSSYVYVNNNIVDTPAQQGSITDFTGTNISNRDNIGFNPAGYLASPTPSSPWTYTNSYGYPIELFVNGGPPASNTLPGTITAVQYKGRSLNYPQNSYELRLGPGESATITFTGNIYADVFGL